MADYLQISDLDNCITRARVIQYLDDDGDGIVSSSDPAVIMVLGTAEATAATRMLRALTRDQVVLLANNDAVFKNHVAWLACEIASERRPEFLDAEGRGAHWAQYQRALQEIDLLSKSNIRSLGERIAGTLGTAGGQTSAHGVDDGSVFQIAPTRRRDPGAFGGQGGF